MPTAPTATSPAHARGSVALTHGFRVSVQPRYMPEQSDPTGRQWLFAYRIRIANEGAEPAQLQSRRWVIVDSHGTREEVKGPGVVGQQPRLEPGQSFEYTSFCPLRTPWGTMEGSYHFRTDDGRELDVAVARFYLVSEEDRAAGPAR
jgi:ApaG protein